MQAKIDGIEINVRGNGFDFKDEDAAFAWFLAHVPVRLVQSLGSIKWRVDDFDDQNITIVGEAEEEK